MWTQPLTPRRTQTRASPPAIWDSRWFLRVVVGWCRGEDNRECSVTPRTVRLVGTIDRCQIGHWKRNRVTSRWGGGGFPSAVASSSDAHNPVVFWKEENPPHKHNSQRGSFEESQQTLSDKLFPFNVSISAAAPRALVATSRSSPSSTSLRVPVCSSC